MLTADPVPKTRPELYSRAKEALPEAEHDNAVPLIDSVLSLCVFRASQSMPAEQFATELGDMVDLEDDETKRSIFVQRTESLLGLDSITEVAKAIDLIADNDKVFGAARIITDIRPVFSDNPKAPPTGAVVLHTLKIEAMTPSGPTATYYVLDDVDLLQMQKSLERAIDKSTSIQTLLSSAGLAPLQPFGS